MHNVHRGWWLALEQNHFLQGRGVDQELTSQSPLVREYLGVIGEAIEAVSRRHRLNQEEQEEFSSEAFLKILDDGCKVLRAYKGKASMKAYLVGVLTRFLYNFRDRQWGKWQPSAEAKRLGGEAVLLEKLLTRDEYSHQEAFEMLTTNHRLAWSVEYFEEMVAKLPVRHKRRHLNQEVLEFLPTDAHMGEDRLRQQEARGLRSRTGRVLRSELAKLSGRERLVIRMHYHDGFSVATIAKLLDTDAKKLYRFFELIRQRFRHHLENAGVVEKEIMEYLDNGGFLIQMESAKGTLSNHLS